MAGLSNSLVALLGSIIETMGMNMRLIMNNVVDIKYDILLQELKVEVGMAGLSNSLVALLGLIALFGIPLMQAAVNRFRLFS